VVIVTNHTTQKTSQLFDPKYPGAHLPFQQRRSLTPRWTSPHLTLFATPKAFLSKPDVRYPEPFKPRPYPAPPIKPEQRRADMSMQVVAIRSRIILHQALRGTIKRRLREAVKLIVTRGAAVEESPKGPKVVFRAGDVGAEKWIAPGMLLSLSLWHAASKRFAIVQSLLFTRDVAFSHADWTYIAMPTSELFRMPFAELLSLMRQALEYLHQSIPEAEKILRCGGRENGGSSSLVRLPKKMFIRSTCTVG
jgi:hypothetical protein